MRRSGRPTLSRATPDPLASGVRILSVFAFRRAPSGSTNDTEGGVFSVPLRLALDPEQTPNLVGVAALHSCLA